MGLPPALRITQSVGIERKVVVMAPLLPVMVSTGGLTDLSREMAGLMLLTPIKKKKKINGNGL